MSDSGKKRRRSRKTKEQKLLEKLEKEEKEENERKLKEEENQTNNNNNNNNSNTLVKEYEMIEGLMANDQELFNNMMNMDVRVKYSFIKTLHNNLISINSRFNWKPEELMAIGSIFKDFQSIEVNVYNTVIQQTSVIEEEEEEEEEEEVEEEEVEDIQ